MIKKLVEANSGIIDQQEMEVMKGTLHACEAALEEAQRVESPLLSRKRHLQQTKILNWQMHLNNLKKIEEKVNDLRVAERIRQQVEH